MRIGILCGHFGFGGGTERYARDVVSALAKRQRKQAPYPPFPQAIHSTGDMDYWLLAEGNHRLPHTPGASLWVFANKKPETYKGVTAFFKFLASPEIAARWHQQTGYVPVTKAAYELTKKEGFYDKNPGTEVGVKQLNVETTAQSRGLRLGFLPQIREIEDAEIERIVSGKVSAKDGAENIVKRGNELLEKFEKSVK